MEHSPEETDVHQEPSGPRVPELEQFANPERTVVDTGKNATEDVVHHIKPGKIRAPFFRYFRFNLPRLTKLALLVLVAGIGVTAVVVGASSHPPFDYAQIPLFIIATAAAVFVLIGIVSKQRIWDFGLFIALAALVAYIGGIFGNAPYVWNGAPLELAAVWNLMMLLSLAYLVAYWALTYGMLVAYPDKQDFPD